LSLSPTLSAHRLFVLFWFIAARFLAAELSLGGYDAACRSGFGAGFRRRSRLRRHSGNAMLKTAKMAMETPMKSLASKDRQLGHGYPETDDEALVYVLERLEDPSVRVGV
jgi:hypothetical protein